MNYFIKNGKFRKAIGYPLRKHRSFKFRKGFRVRRLKNLLGKLKLYRRKLK